MLRKAATLLPLLLVSAPLVQAPTPDVSAPPPVQVERTVTPPARGPRLARIRRILERNAPALNPLERAMVAEVVYDGELHHGIDAPLTLAVIEQESRFDPRAVSSVGALGLMQVRPFVGRAVARRHAIPWSGRDTLFDPVRNVQIGIRYLAEMHERHPERELALTAYNVGPSRLAKLLERGAAAPTRYSGEVLRRYARLVSSAPPAAPAP